MPIPYELGAVGRDWTERTRRVAETSVAPAAAEVDQEARFPAEGIQALADQGFFGLTLPSECGGHDQPPKVFAAVVEELAWACGSTAMIYVMHVAAAQAPVASTTFTDRDALLNEIAAGRHLTTLAFSERGSRSQFWAPVSRLERNEHGYITNAHKSWVTAAHHADSYVSSAQKPDAASPLESALYLVRRDSEGVRIDGEFRGLGLRGNDSAPVVLENLHVAEGDLLTEPGDGARMMLEVVLPWFIVGTAAMALGLCRAAIERTAEHLSDAGFANNGSRLRDLPNLRARLAEMNVRTEQARSLLSVAARAMEAPDDQTPLFVLQARLAALETALHVTDLAMKSCGGAAFSKHLALERYFRDARAGWVMAPTADHLQDFIGRALTGLPLFD